jgi:DNA-binding transcriptional regulator YdaS (Cro superfamily)
MKLKQWLDDGVGRAKALADHLGVSASMVSQMAAETVRIPPANYTLIRDFTSNEVSIEEMLPPQKKVGEEQKPTPDHAQAAKASPDTDRRNAEQARMLKRALITRDGPSKERGGRHG